MTGEKKRMKKQTRVVFYFSWGEITLAVFSINTSHKWHNLEMEVSRHRTEDGIGSEK